MDQTRKTNDYARLAPGVDRDWVEKFVIEQRLLGVPGQQIGDALALVQSHLAESGESAQEAFGDAQTYARESNAPRRIVDSDPGWLLGAGLGLVGMLMTTAGATTWLFGAGTVEVTVGDLVTALLMLAIFGVLALRPEAVLRVAVSRTGLSIFATVAWVALVVGVLLLLRTPLFVLPAPAVTAAGVLLLLLGTVLELRTKLAGGLDDPIVGPGEERSRASEGRLTWFTVFLFPVLTVLLLALSWVMDLLS